jgi:hypothetical protein
MKTSTALILVIMFFSVSMVFSSTTAYDNSSAGVKKGD